MGIGAYLRIVLIVVSVVLIGLVLVQTKGAGSMFGSGDSGVYQTRRGLEKTIFNTTIVFSALFLGISLLIIFVDQP